MTASGRHDPLSVDRRMAKTTAVGLGIWLAITLAVVVLLLTFGSALTGVLV